MCVDPHEASLDLGGDPVRLGEVLRPYASAEPVLARVRKFHAFTIALNRHDTTSPSAVTKGIVGKAHVSVTPRKQPDTRRPVKRAGNVKSELTEKRVTTTTGPKTSSRQRSS